MKKVIIYTTSTCSYCDKAKEYLKSKEVNFTEVDLTENPEETQKLIKKTGYTAVPQLEIDGKIIVGFDQAKIHELIKE